MKKMDIEWIIGGPDSKIFRSYDSGKTWEDISEFNGLPSFLGE